MREASQHVVRMLKGPDPISKLQVFMRRSRRIVTYRVVLLIGSDPIRCEYGLHYARVGDDQSADKRKTSRLRQSAVIALARGY